MVSYNVYIGILVVVIIIAVAGFVTLIALGAINNNLLFYAFITPFALIGVGAGLGIHHLITSKEENEKITGGGDCPNGCRDDKICCAKCIGTKPDCTNINVYSSDTNIKSLLEKEWECVYLHMENRINPVIKVDIMNYKNKYEKEKYKKLCIIAKDGTFSDLNDDFNSLIVELELTDYNMNDSVKNNTSRLTLNNCNGNVDIPFGKLELYELNINSCYLYKLTSIANRRISHSTTHQNIESIFDDALIMKLSIKSCPNLNKIDIDNKCPKLTTISIEGCKLLEDLSFIERCPNLQSIVIKKCTWIKEIPDIRTGFLIKDANTSLNEVTIEGCTDLIDLSCIKGCTKLLSIVIKNCPKLKSLPDILSGKDHNTSLNRVSIEGCAALNDLSCIKGCTALESIVIKNCPMLKEFPDIRTGTIFARNSNTSLKSVIIENCDGINLSNLQYSNAKIYIINCKGVNTKDINTNRILHYDGDPNTSYPSVHRMLDNTRANIHKGMLKAFENAASNAENRMKNTPAQSEKEEQVTL